VDEARTMIDKIVAFEAEGPGFRGPALFVADNADLAGNFEQDADDAASLFGESAVEKVYLRDFGGASRPAIQQALDRGPSFVSYVGHGGTAVWASENIWNNLDVNTLAYGTRPHLLLTMNCLNGFFHFPSLNSLAEQFLKADGKGAVAAFSPSGLSVNEPAHLLHKMLLAEVLSGRHARLGDAVLAAQASYTDSGAFPELLNIYNLLGDPALRLR
jgi:Peptidase family C25